MIGLRANMSKLMGKKCSRCGKKECECEREHEDPMEMFSMKDEKAKLLKKQKNPPKSKAKKHKAVIDTVRNMLNERNLKGIETYGTSLYPFNGRSALQDALEEALDLVMYLTQLAIEQKIIKQ